MSRGQRNISQSSLASRFLAQFTPFLIQSCVIFIRVSEQKDFENTLIGISLLLQPLIACVVQCFYPVGRTYAIEYVPPSRWEVPIAPSDLVPSLQPVPSPYLSMNYICNLDSQNDIDYRRLGFEEGPDGELLCPVLHQLFTNPMRVLDEKTNTVLGPVEESALRHSAQVNGRHPLSRRPFNVNAMVLDEKLAEKAKKFLENAKACKVLGVPLKATDDEVKRAFTKKAKSQGKELLSAYQTLINPKKLTVDTVPAIKYQADNYSANLN